MNPRYSAWVAPAKPMAAIGRRRWYATARARQLVAGRDDAYVRIPGEWHGSTPEEAEAKARRAAEEWIARRA